MFWKSKRKLIVIVITVVALVFFIFAVPNLINHNETQSFERSLQIEHAKQQFQADELSDSVELVTSQFYHTSTFGNWLLGKHHRALWTTPVRLPVFKGLDTLEYLKIGGGQQTTSVEVRNEKKMHYSFRSVDKDNAKVLPALFKKSFLRPFLRDQASAINPYAAPVVSSLLSTLEIPHPMPVLYLLPYTTDQDSVSLALGGEVVIMVEELNKHWAEEARFLHPDKIMKTEDVLAAKDSLNINVALYIRCRLFDFLVSDWDRHEKQWKWGIKNNTAWPIPLDRDMALCKYDDGLISKLVRIFNNKFQSFNKGSINLEGLTRNSGELDRALLKYVPVEIYQKQAKLITEKLNVTSIQCAFEEYPPAIYDQVGASHMDILQYRLQKIPQVAVAFHALINE